LLDIFIEIVERLRATLNETIRNPMKYTLGTAAKATGKSKATIHRAIKNGVISANRLEDGSYEIDPAELHRVYPPVSGNGSAEQEMRRYATPNETSETAVLLAKIEGLEALLNRERETVTDLRRRLDQSETERRETQAKLTALLTYHPKPESAAQHDTQGKGGLFEKLFGKMK
jgi:hypothetical protein